MPANSKKAQPECHFHVLIMELLFPIAGHMDLTRMIIYIYKGIPKIRETALVSTLQGGGKPFPFIKVALTYVF